MAQRKRKGAKENPKAAERQRTGGDTAGEVIKNIALFAIPGGGFVRIGMTGGKIAGGALAALRRMFPKAKRVSKPTKAQVDKAKPISALKPVTKPSGPATRGGRRGPRKNEVIEGKAVEKSSKPVRTTKPADKKPGTSVATRPGTQVKKPGTGVMEIRQAPKKPRGMKRADATDVTKAKPRVKGPDRAKANKTLRNLLIAAGAAAGATGTAYLAGRKGKDATATTPSKPTPKPKTVPKPTPKPKKPRTTPDTKKISPKGRPGATTPDTKKISPKGKPGATTPDTKKMPPKGRPITAGKNTGFGPKGNIFPSNAAERAALMKMYGGTGSAAAKAAAAGKQGDMKAGKAAYEKAKRERLKGKK